VVRFGTQGCRGHGGAPVFLQAPWVRVHPFSATLFTALLVAIGVVLNRSDNQQKADFGSLIRWF
jgi:hypothetical protein